MRKLERGFSLIEGWIMAQNGVLVKSGTTPTYNWVDPSTLDGLLDFPGMLGVGAPGEAAGYVKIVTWKITY